MGMQGKSGSHVVELSMRGPQQHLSSIYSKEGEVPAPLDASKHDDDDRCKGSLPLMRKVLDCLPLAMTSTVSRTGFGSKIFRGKPRMFAAVRGQGVQREGDGPELNCLHDVPRLGSVNLPVGKVYIAQHTCISSESWRDRIAHRFWSPSLVQLNRRVYLCLRG